MCNCSVWHPREHAAFQKNTVTLHESLLPYTERWPFLFCDWRPSAAGGASVPGALQEVGKFNAEFQYRCHTGSASDAACKGYPSAVVSACRKRIQIESQQMADNECHRGCMPSILFCSMLAACVWQAAALPGTLSPEYLMMRQAAEVHAKGRMPEAGEKKTLNYTLQTRRAS
jgi:hypothetical protein